MVVFLRRYIAREPQDREGPHPLPSSGLPGEAFPVLYCIYCGSPLRRQDRRWGTMAHPWCLGLMLERS